MSKPLVSVIIPTFNRENDLVRLLQSIRKSSIDKEGLELIVVDNARSKTLQKKIEKTYPGARLVQSENNLYCSGGRKLGADVASGKYLFFIDDDNILPENCIRALVAAMEQDKKIGVAAPIMAYWSKKNTVWCAGGVITTLGLVAYLGKGQEVRDVQSGPELKGIDFFPNAFMVRKEALKDAPFDLDNFIHNWSEADLCARIRNNGYTLNTVKDAITYHDIDYDGSITRLGTFNTYDQAFSRIIFRKQHRNTIKQWGLFWGIVFPVSTMYYLQKIYGQHEIKRSSLTNAYFKGTVKAVMYRPKQLRTE